MVVRVAHLSRARNAADGGVAMAVSELLSVQHAHSSLHPAWFAPQPDPPLAASVRSFSPHVLHVHGLWRAPNRLAVRMHSRLPVVVAPHGMLDPWALTQHRWRKTLLWLAYERRLLHRVAALQALCPAEVQALRCRGLTTPIALIPNGVSLPDPSAANEPLPPPCWAGAIPPLERVLLFLGRFHHKKGIQPLLQAWQSVTADAARAGWWLALVGYGDGGQLEQQLKAQPLARVVACGPVFAAAKHSVLSAASAFVLPSYSEWLPMACLEAMAYQLPCLISPACNLPDAFRLGAAIPTDPDPAAIAASLQQLFDLGTEDRSAMGAVGHALVREHFSWPVIAEQTFQLYSWMLGGGEPPGFVEL